MNRKETIKPCLTVTKREGDTYTEGHLNERDVPYMNPETKKVVKFQLEKE